MPAMLNFLLVLLMAILFLFIIGYLAQLVMTRFGVPADIQKIVFLIMLVVFLLFLFASYSSGGLSLVAH